MNKILVLALVIVGLSPMQAQAFTGGTVTGNVVISKSQSPWRLTKTVIVPEGQSLTVEPGVEIRVAHNGWAFQVGGTLAIGGPEQVTKVTGNSRKFISIPDTQASARVLLYGLAAQNLGETEIENGQEFSLSDSRISGVSTFSSFYSEAPVSFERNSFYFSPRVGNLGANDSCKSFGIAVSYPFAETKVSYNSFSGGSKDFRDRQCASWLFIAQLEGREQPVEMLDNAFNSLPTTIGWFPTGAVMQGTYLNGANNIQAFEQSVWDSKDDLGLLGIVVFESNRSAPSDLTADFLIEPQMVKFRNCAAMNREFPGGVAKSRSSANIGQAVTVKPFINSRLYDRNKSLDRDRDGLACER